jgi:hypothetical protein
MLQSLLLRWKIWRLDRKWAASVKRTYKAVEAARAQNASEQELKEIAGGRDDYLWRQRINALQTAYLLSQADRLIVAVPDFYDPTMWVHDGDRQRAASSSPCGCYPVFATSQRDHLLGPRRCRRLASRPPPPFRPQGGVQSGYCLL